jgi:hypothetical protein
MSHAQTKSSYDYGETCVMLVCLLIVGGVNFVVMSCYEMPSYYAKLVSSNLN